MSPTPETTVATSDETTQKYKDIVKSNGITDEVSEVIVKNAGLQGEGFASITKCVTVKFSNPKLQPLNLFVKAHSSNPSHSKMLEELKAFDKEGRFLTEYVSAAKELCKKKGLDNFVDFYAKCYYGDKDIIVLENLVLDKGFALVDKAVKQGMDEATFALNTLAKHHALAYAMIAEHGGPEKFFRKFEHFDFEPFKESFAKVVMEPMTENGLTTITQVLEQDNDVEGKDEALVMLKSKAGTTYQAMMDNLHLDEDGEPLLTLNHGDYWNNNMMFLKDKETGKVLRHIAIDLQVLRYNTPMLDLSYYLFTSVQPNVRRANMKKLLEIYLTALRRHSKDLGHPINLTYDEMFMQFRKKFEMGFWIGVAMGPATSILKDINIEEIDIANWGAVMMELVQKWLKNNPDKGVELAEETVALVNEYNQFKIE